MSTLRRWRRDGIIAPSVVVHGEQGEADTEGYTYGDVTIVRMIRAIREDRFDFRTAAIALWHLNERLGPPRTWANARVYFTGPYVFADRPDDWAITEATQAGQATMPELFGDLFENLREADELGDILVPEPFRPYVTVNPNVMSGDPVVRGTRAPTSLFAALKAKGHTVATIVAAYSMIPRQFIEKAIEYEEYVTRALSGQQGNKTATA